MIIQYKIDEHDFLAFQLFTASRSKRINKKKKNGTIFLTIGSVITSIFFYLDQNYLLAIYFAFFSIITALFYPKYFKWRYKKHYKSYIKENYFKRFGQTEYLEIKGDSLYSKNKAGEGSIKISEIDRVDETFNHFFLKISTGMSLIIPKEQISNSEELKTKFKSLGLTLNNPKDRVYGCKDE